MFSCLIQYLFVFSKKESQLNGPFPPVNNEIPCFLLFAFIFNVKFDNILKQVWKYGEGNEYGLYKLKSNAMA
jgi:hypothetical protein